MESAANARLAIGEPDWYTHCSIRADRKIDMSEEETRSQKQGEGGGGSGAIVNVLLIIQSYNETNEQCICYQYNYFPVILGTNFLRRKGRWVSLYCGVCSMDVQASTFPLSPGPPSKLETGIVRILAASIPALKGDFVCYFFLKRVVRK